MKQLNAFFEYRNRKRILVAGIGVIFCIACIWKIDGIYKIIKNTKAVISRQIEYQVMHSKNVQIDDKQPLLDEKDAWYTKYHFISHAGGGYVGKTYTNSLEAWENSYEMGNRVFDADLAFTSDGILVLRHEWDDNLEQENCSIRESVFRIDLNGQTHFVDGTSEDIPMTYEEFIDKKIFYCYTPMSCDDMLKFMNEHKDLYVSCDMKDDIRMSYKFLVERAIELSMDDILDRIIVNIYDYASYDIVMETYSFKNVTMRQHYGRCNNYYELIDFCLGHNIHVINLSRCYIEDEGVQIMRSKGIHVYVATADYISDMQDYYRLGADGAVTNWLYEDDWRFVE